MFVQTALVFTACTLSGATAYCYCCLHGMHSTAAILPIGAYAAVLLLLLAPMSVLNVNSRFFFASTLARVLVPLQEVTWSDFLLADVFTSLSKCSSDIAKAACALAIGEPRHVMIWRAGAARCVWAARCGAPRGM